MKVAIVDHKGKETGRDVELPESYFNVEPNEHVVYLAVKSYLAAKRQGTASTKERSEVVGSTKKIRKQKGTGMARAGDIKNPLFRGGGTVFGPKPRKYQVRLNKKERVLAKKSVLSEKASNNAISIIEDSSFDEPKTKHFQQILNSLNAEGKVLFVHDGESINAVKSARNLSNVNTVSVEEMSTYQILHADNVLFSENAINKIVE